MSDEEEFNKLWSEISTDPKGPKSFVEYMALQWISNKEMWSLVDRKNRSIFEEGDTNMLIEVSVVLLISLDWVLTCDLIRYHHVLKSYWLDSKRN